MIVTEAELDDQGDASQKKKNMTEDGLYKVIRRLGFRPRYGAMIIGLNLAATVLEGVGVTMLLPIFQFIQSNGDVAALAGESRLWEYLVAAYGWFGIPVTLVALLATSFICILGRQVFFYVRIRYVALVKEGLVRDIRSEGFRHLVFAKLDHQDKEQVGKVVNDFTTELQWAAGSLLSSVMLISYSLLILFYAGVLVGLSGLMTGLAALVFGFTLVVLRRLVAKSEQAGQRVVAANQSMSTFLVERLRSLRLVRLSGTEQAEIDAMSDLTERQRIRMIDVILLMARLEVAIEPILVAAGALFVYCGVTFFHLKIEEIGLFLFIMLRLLPVVKECLKTYQSLLTTKASLRVVDERLCTLSAAREEDDGFRRFEGPDVEITLSDVTFTYKRQNGFPALSNLNLSIPAHKMTALVGPSGGGKSTLIDLLPRLREPPIGVVAVDGVPLDEFDRKSLRDGIAYATQTAQIFNTTIAGHIRYGRPDASDEEVFEATQLAGADEFIDQLPQGYDTLIGENGFMLSGGQRQRLDLARALVKRAPVLILDEPTSNLDAESEAKFVDALRRIRDGTDTTIIIVGHRLSTVSTADKIAVMIDGRIVNSGDHTSLMSDAGWYADAYNRAEVGQNDKDRRVSV
jgi:ABC-type multidrug transport system fused ATPase/permease subunit